MADVRCVEKSAICHLRSDIHHQLPLDPPVLMGFFVTPTALAPGLAMNLDACAAFFGPLAPALPPFLLLTGNPMIFVLSKYTEITFDL